MSTNVLLLAAVLASTLGGAAGAQSPASAAIPTRPAAWAAPIALDGVPNLHRVTEVLFRSAQPEKGGFKSLARTLGIKTVVSLRAFHSDRKLAAGNDLSLISVPINTWDIDRPDIVQALAEIGIAEKRGPVLLHCQHGADRTGLVAALYRMINQGWTREAAIDEMRNGRFGYHAVWGNIPRFLRKVNIARLKKDVSAKTCALEKAADSAKVCRQG